MDTSNYVLQPLNLLSESSMINRQSLANNFEYVMYGKLYRITKGSGREKASPNTAKQITKTEAAKSCVLVD
ncbi:hypothetical protein Fmac_018045 [Flemingia macrophylla]|uniref:Uncharacterized protein n=1 Tax=Flemingia macrophylla TaxID=520843 RepID=A0ABD1M3W0_9FABA